MLALPRSDDTQEEGEGGEEEAGEGEGVIEGAGPRVGVSVRGEEPPGPCKKERKPWRDFSERKTEAREEATAAAAATTAAAAAAAAAGVVVVRQDVLQGGP